MKIKTRLTFGVGLLFLMILLLTIIGMWYINALKRDTNNILTANYNSVQYARNMILALDEIQSDPRAVKDFEDNLELQENNETEVGEKEATQELARHFNALLVQPHDTAIRQIIRKNILTMMDLNMQAIVRKSRVASGTAQIAMVWIAVAGALCFIIAFISLINLPGNIADPIRELTESIKQIAAQNYTRRVHIESNSEFGDLAKSFNIMAEKLEEYSGSSIARLLIEKKRIEALINNMQDPVIGLDENNKILFMNEEALRISGLENENIIGTSIDQIAINNDLIRTLIRDTETMKDNGKKQSEPVKIFANGKESYFEKEVLDIAITSTGDEKKQKAGNVIILRNVTAYKEMDAAKTNFMATVSHEFKTPISSIKMSLQLLKNNRIGGINNEQKDLLNSIEDDINRLLKITGELLNMTQVESGNIQLSVVPADAREILLYAIHSIRKQAEQKHIKLEATYPDYLPEVLADKEKTAWVLINLISNAIRYSYEYSVIYLNLANEEGYINFSVKDTGQGIDPQYKDKIFDRYFRIPGSKEKGTGLGLAISKEFIEAQGGKIDVDSDFGAGSTFTVRLHATESAH
ncbi:MAG: HAMP domain-containing protein [Chitinophagaceae bacterium]|nr:MAG: HAMP domain-containing protein [Chitinophagaceae bacterium]